jgi:hypothetical protein
MGIGGHGLVTKLVTMLPHKNVTNLPRGSKNPASSSMPLACWGYDSRTEIHLAGGKLQ